MLRVLEALTVHLGARVHFVDVDILGHVNMAHLESLLQRTSKAVVSLMHGNNEIGNLLPVRDVSALCLKYGALFHSDTVQTIGKYHIDMTRLLVDFALGSAHKFHGPKGTGFMFVRKGTAIGSLIAGGGQERNMRAGTENLCGIVGMSKALELTAGTLEDDRLYIQGLKDHLIASLQAQVPSIGFNGDTGPHSLYSIVNILLPGEVDHDMLVPRFDMAGICLSSGSACSSGSSVGSHVLAALGRDKKDPSIRVSFSRYNTMAEVDTLVGVIRSMCG